MLDQKVRTLINVCETMSFTRAAAELSLTQPAVSQHVKQLEHEFGIKIFHRKEGELRLTAEGEILLRYAKRFTNMYDELRKNIHEEKRFLKLITVGITHTSESNQIAEALARYCSINDGVKMTVVTDTINNLYEKLKNYEVDIAIVEGKCVEGGFWTVHLDTDLLVAALSNDNPLAKHGIITIEELKKEKMILRLPDSGTRNLFVSHLESLNISIDEFNVILEVNNIATIKDLIRRGFGISILARSVCLDELRKGKITVLPVENLSMEREINIVCNKDFEHRDILRDIARTYAETSRLYELGVNGAADV